MQCNALIIMVSELACGARTKKVKVFYAALTPPVLDLGWSSSEVGRVGMSFST